MRARAPLAEGVVDNDGVRLHYEVFGPDDDRQRPTVLLLPTWTIIHSRFWKMQVPDLARRWRVITYDGPGNGLSDRPTTSEPYRQHAQVRGALRVLDATETPQAAVVSLSRAVNWLLDLAANHPERVTGAAFISSSIDLAPPYPERAEAWATFQEPVDRPERWRKMNASHWLADWPDFPPFFFGECFSEPHSTKQIEDTVGWALETTPEVMVAEVVASRPPEALLKEWCGRVRCPVLVVHGDDDHLNSIAASEVLAAETGGELVVLEGVGHIPVARDPVRINLLLREFLERVAPPPPAPARWRRGRTRPKRALFVSSPIGLGHARRDVAVVDELRRHHLDLQVDWLAQHPVTEVLADAGETVHPASREMASESAHIESESGEHDLHCFQAWRRMDEILLADFMVFHDVVRDADYDLVIGDEAWDVDYYLHENPELKRFAYVWMTDFVGWLPMPDGGDHEAYLSADYNAEMIGHIARFPRVRDRALFVGNPEDVVPDRFGDGLPLIADWTREHYDFPGYVTGFDPASVGERDELRAELGYEPGEPVCVVTVGGSGVGSDLLRRVVDAFPAAARRIPGLRMVVVTGPRIDPESLPHRPGIEAHAYVPRLYRHLAASDLAVVQGGLTTCMELTATGRPYLYVPLRHHFEQNFHVAHRLGNYGAGRRVDYDATEPDALADVIVAELGREVRYRPVEQDGAAAAAAAIAELL